MNCLLRKYAWMTVLCFCFAVSVSAQEIAVPDSVPASVSAEQHADSVAADSLVSPSKKKTKIESPIAYSSTDSIVLSMSGNAYLYGESKIKYGEIDLAANYIHLNTDSSIVTARGALDEDSVLVGTPVLTDNGEEYNATRLRYNFSTKKGFINHGVVQQGDGFIIGERIKKIDDEYLCMKDGKYTTCDHHDHPHFYLNLTKAKIKQKKWVVTGPAYLVLLDVPLPLALPFGYFPFSKSYSSGVIMPGYGDDFNRGYYLYNGGYYFAFNDYVDLALTGDIYTKGTWAVNAASSYRKRYRYSGNANFSYREDVTGMRELPDTYMKMKNMSILWTHTQDPKASPNSTFSASVNFSSSGYDRSNVDNYYNPALLSQDTKYSSISYGRSFPNTPFSFTAGLAASQSTRDSMVYLQTPDLTFTMSRVYPFKRKNAIGKARWYEKIYMSYNGSLSNSINTKERLLAESSFTNDWKNGMRHSLPIGASFNVLKYVSITPTVNYNERWYLQKQEQNWDAANRQMMNDTTNGFYRVYDFSTGISASTKVYGFFTPSKKIFGDKVDRLRHVITPTVSYSFRPDFSDPMWGSWKSYNDSTGAEVRYSPFAGGIYGTSTAGKSSSISFSLANNLEMKWKQENDSTGEAEYKTVSLIDNFSFNNSYNFAADSMNWGNFTANLRLKFSQSYSLNLSGQFETYLYGLNSAGYPVRINTPRWEVGKLPRLINTSTSFSYSISNETFKKKKDKTENETQQVNDSTKQEPKPQLADEDGYQQYRLPWSLSFDYSVNYGNTSEFDKNIMEYKRRLTHNIGMRGNLSLTSKWNFTFSASYDFQAKEITYSSLGISRNLHCWTMTANVVPFGPYQSYNFLIQVSSSLLADLKYEKRSDYSPTTNWY
ncbi:MAG: LPS-assembly protein LptD [Prevotellaceae bacterium]|nr:LPS-assembly protein LptD [Prevotellaceae bacterium]